MFRFVGKLLSRVSIGALIREIKLDIDTVDKAAGYGLRIRVEAFGITLLDEFIRIGSLEHPVDELRTNKQNIERLN